MRLLRTVTLQLKVFDDESSLPNYAILSHRWDQDSEGLFQDLAQVETTKRRSRKCRTRKDDDQDFEKKNASGMAEDQSLL